MLPLQTPILGTIYRTSHRFWLPQVRPQAPGKNSCWILVDQLGANMLKGLTPVILGKAAPFVLNHCHVYRTRIWG